MSEPSNRASLYFVLTAALFIVLFVMLISIFPARYSISKPATIPSAMHRRLALSLLIFAADIFAAWRFLVHFLKDHPFY